MAPWIFLALAVWGATFTVMAMFPSRSKVLLLPTFFASWLTIELAAHHLVLQVAATAAFVAWFDVLDHPAGWVGLAISAASWVALVVMVLQARQSAVTMRELLADIAGDEPAPRVPLRMKVVPFLMRRRDVKVQRNIVFAKVAGRRLKLDVFTPRAGGEGLPVVLQIHGGGWMIGDKREQGIPLLTHLAANGWVGVNANYRLSPGATFPDHLVDLKRALAWIREHIADHGGDPSFVAVTGGSAGGHLTALMALTANDPEYQPGFEDVDTSLRAAVPFYGVYDFTNRNSTFHPDFHRLFIEPYVMKKFFAEEPEAFAKASPIDLVREDAPPFLIIHGDRDTLAPVEDARDFARLLEQRSSSPVLYAELHGSQHAFDIFPSIRTAAIIESVERFLRAVRRGELTKATPDAVSGGITEEAPMEASTAAD